MPPREGLTGLDTSLPYSAEPLSHVFLIIPGAGDPYIDQPPWLSSLETCLHHLSTNYKLLTRRTRTPSALFLPVQWHTVASDTWQSTLSQAHPTVPAPRIRHAVAETLGDVLLPASPFWRSAIARHVAAQIQTQLAGVRRNRPAFSGRVSIVAHSVGGMIAVQLLADQLLDIDVDAVVFTGCPLSAYAALAPDKNQIALSTIRKFRSSIRFFNVFHPLDPVAFRLEPFVVDKLEECVKVAALKRTFWDDAGLFWDDVVYNLWSTLFPPGHRNNTPFGDMLRIGSVQRESEVDDEVRRKAIYKDGDEMGGREVLLGGRIDFELEDGMRVPPLDVMASWGAIKAHSYYWQCADVAQMLVDIAATSDEAKKMRKDVWAPINEHASAMPEGENENV